MGNVHTVGPDEALIVSGKLVNFSKVLQKQHCFKLLLNYG